MDRRRTTNGAAGAALAVVLIGGPHFQPAGHAAQPDHAWAADESRNDVSNPANAESGDPQVNPPAGRVFHSGGIVNRASGKALDVQNRSTDDGAPIQQWEFTRQSNQMWNVVDQGGGRYAILSQASGKALDVTNHQANDGARIQQFGFAKADNQLWKVEQTTDGYYQIVSLSSGKCLDVELGSINENGAIVQQWNCAGQPNQQWRLVK
jgi:hypothetical protein